MHTLPLSFALLTYSGYWRPVKWPRDSAKYWLYNGYSVFMILFLHAFAACGLVDLLTSEDATTMINKFSLFISVAGVCCKMINMFVRRGKIIGVVNVLLAKNCLPRDSEESGIRQKFNDHARKLTIYCEILNESAVFFATVAQFKRLLKTGTLDGIPYDLSSRTVFVVSVLHQTLGLMICANASVAHETLISGLMIQICAQFEILCHRARSLPKLLKQAQVNSESLLDLRKKEKNITNDLIRFHLDVYRFAVRVNAVFNLMIFIQFLISSSVLCFSVYKMSTTNPLTVDFAWTASYLCCMLMQVYLYCWYGNEVTLKSGQIGNAIYEMDWTTMPVPVMKDLLIIMTRSTRPIKMSSGYILTLSTQSFMSIMKMSYTSYNLLKDSSK